MKRLLFSLLNAAGLTRLCAWYFRKHVAFLCYHGVTNRPADLPRDVKGLHVQVERFKQHLDFLQRRYHVISLADFIAAQHHRKSLPAYSLVLTFDDGFRNFLTVAAPLLAERKMPATVFLITDRAAQEQIESLDTEWSPEDDQRYLSWAEARQLQQSPYFNFGSHTCSHPGLLTLSPRESRHELQHSYEDLMSHLDIEVSTLSYPKGQYSKVIANEARNVGYACAVTTDRGVNEIDHDPFTLGRTLIGDFDDQASFAVRVSGLRWCLIRILALFVPSRDGRMRQPAPRADRYRDEAYHPSNL